MTNAHIFFSGTVQGVGFRYTARHIANSLNLTGWVKNLSDGRVEIVCEGSESGINKFIKLLEEEFTRYISDKEIDWLEASGRFDGFNIMI